MEMRPLLQAIADGDTVAFVYEMYLTPKGMENAPTFTMMATEFNHFKMVGVKTHSHPFGYVYRWRKDELTCQKIACNDCKIR